MNNKFFQIDEEEVGYEQTQETQVYDSNIFTNAMGYDSSKLGSSLEDNSNFENEYYENEQNSEEDNLSNELIEELEENVGEETKINNDSELVNNIFYNNTSNSVISEDHNFINDKTAFVSKEESLDDDIPKNPVYVEEQKVVSEAKVNIFTVIAMLFGSMLKPGTSVFSNALKYENTKKAISITIYIVAIVILLSVGTDFITSSFVKVYDINTGSYSTVVNFSNMFGQNYLETILVSGILTFMTIMVFALIYFASSFIRNKGVTFGTYIMISNMALFPFIFAVSTLYPLAVIFSYYLGFLIVLIFLILAIFSYFNAIGKILEFKNDNHKIFYNLINFTFILIIFIAAVVLFFEEDLNAVTNLINTAL